MKISHHIYHNHPIYSKMFKKITTQKLQNLSLDTNKSHCSHISAPLRHIRRSALSMLWSFSQTRKCYKIRTNETIINVFTTLNV